MAEAQQKESHRLVVTDPKQICIHFANTVVWRAGERPEEVLTNVDVLLRFGRVAGIIDDVELERLRQQVVLYPEQANSAFERAKVGREALYRILFATANGMQTNPDDVAFLNDLIEEAQDQLRLEPNESGQQFEWRWKSDDTQIDRVLWAAVRSAAELLTSEELQKIKSCPGEGCGYLFMDVSRNGKRRWCEMDLCGNRSKVKRFRQVHNADR